MIHDFMALQIIILAAGKGKRMNSDQPKVLCTLAGRPIIFYLFDTIQKLKLPNKPITVVGYQAQKVKDAIGDLSDYVYQPEQLGTGHAVFCAKNNLKNFDGDILVLYGDMPLIKPATIEKIYQSHQDNQALLTLATTTVEDFNDWRAGFYSFGRILRNDKNEIIGIKEKADSTPKELLITEVNPSYFCFNSRWLWNNIDKLKTDNNQKELYLTDLIKIAFAQNLKINSVAIDVYECLGINTPEQLNLVEKLLIKKSKKD